MGVDLGCGEGTGKTTHKTGFADHFIVLNEGVRLIKSGDFSQNKFFSKVII